MKTNITQMKTQYYLLLIGVFWFISAFITEFIPLGGKLTETMKIISGYFCIIQSSIFLVGAIIYKKLDNILKNGKTYFGKNTKG
mgnify:CR=1 FL=1